MDNTSIDVVITEEGFEYIIVFMTEECAQAKAHDPLSSDLCDIFQVGDGRYLIKNLTTGKYWDYYAALPDAVTKALGITP